MSAVTCLGTGQNFWGTRDGTVDRGRGDFSREKGGGEKMGQRDIFPGDKTGVNTLFPRLIFPKTRPRYPVNFDRSLGEACV